MHPESLALPESVEEFDFKTLPSHGGVYTLATATDEPIITLSAQNIRQSIKHRLTAPEESPGPRAKLDAIVGKVWWTPAYSTFEADLVYLEIARQLHPTDYRKLIRFGAAWWATLNLREHLPRWRVTSIVEPNLLNVGPFDKRSRAHDFVAELEHLFELCRDYDILEKVPKGEPCVYFEMGRCPAPCDGSISLDRYREMMAASARFATGQTQPMLDAFNDEMTRAAAARDYSLAARCRERVERAEKLVWVPGRYGTTYEGMRYLILQRGRTRNWLQPFFVDRGEFVRGDQVRIKDIDDHVEEWLQRAGRQSPTSDISVAMRSEHLWLVTHYLMKQKAAPGVFLNATQLPTPDKLLRRIHAAFATKRKASDTKNATP